jgi:hypothetical protein
MWGVVRDRRASTDGQGKEIRIDIRLSKVRATREDEFAGGRQLVNRKGLAA